MEKDDIRSYKLYKNFIYGHPQSNISLPFYSIDSLKSFNHYKNDPEFIKLGYKENSISYDFNPLGHRSIPARNLQHNNYILFTGCSYTEGLGLSLQEIYPDLVSKHFNIPYYNLALQSSGNDLIAYNLTSWLSNIQPKPKLIVLQYSFLYRFFITPTKDSAINIGLWDLGGIDKNLNDNFSQYPFTPEEQNLYLEYSSNPIISYNNFKILRYQLLSFINLFNIPVIEIGNPRNKLDLSSNISIPWVDPARDMMHPGRKSHQLLSNNIIKEIVGKKYL